MHHDRGGHALSLTKAATDIILMRKHAQHGEEVAMILLETDVAVLWPERL
ncbi:hypothetical protein [Solidesulfovibrio carbinolicus]|nr:hypothetical protein [Solidesulfovibrio carbinolicus]